VTAAQADWQIKENLTVTVERGWQPMRVLVSPVTYRAMVERDGLSPRHIGAHACTTLLTFVEGFALVVDCDKGVPDAAIVTAALKARGLR
jgi:hypothetical protein